MTPTTDLSILTLIANASVVVKSVLALLLILSVTSWTVIFKKYFVLNRTMAEIQAFENTFWGGAELSGLYERCSQNPMKQGVEERLFVAGMREFLKHEGSSQSINGVSRAMSAVYTRETDRLEKGLPMLATIGSSAPFIGLFGTVWGIMNAFTGLATLDNVSLAVVAPGIAEALVATAIGIFAAIPASAAYNYFSHRLNTISARMDGFAEEFLNILERQSQRG